MNPQSAQSQFNMIVPGQTSTRRDDVKLLEPGPNVGILYSIIDLGTHYNEHFKKSNRLLRLTFEFPLLQQYFRVGDTEKRPTVVSVEHTFQIAERSNLKKFIDGALGRILQPHEYKNGFNIGQFLGKTMVVTISHQPSKKDPTKIYERIQSVSGVTEHIRNTYSFDWSLVQRVNDLQGFLIDPEGKCFQKEVFGRLPDFLRDKIMASDEAKAYASRGGTFREKEQTSDNNSGTSQPPSNAPAPVQRTPQPEQKNIITAQDGRKLIWLDAQFTYEQYKAQGWQDDALIAGGYAKVHVEPTPAPAAPQAPQAPQAPAVPLPQAPQAPQAPQQPAGAALPQQPAQQPQQPNNFDADVDDIAF